MEGWEDSQLVASVAKQIFESQSPSYNAMARVDGVLSPQEVIVT